MTMTSRMLLLCLLGNIIDIGGVGAYEIFGTTDPKALVLTYPQRPESLPNATNLVALLHVPVEHEGDAFAFLARVYNAQPFYFQIWRPTSNSKEVQLIASKQVIPSIGQNRHENFYQLGDHCVHVKPGDRLGLYFTTKVPPVYYGTYSFNDKIEVTEMPKVGDTFTFENKLPVEFVAAGFVGNINSNAPDGVTMVRCNNNETIDTDVNQSASTTTTYVPPTGVPGMTGPIGQRGAKGLTGNTGTTGANGPMGAAGAVGVTGPRGPTGDTGASNFHKGGVGAVGATGSRGDDGKAGPQGVEGEIGATGPQGLGGENYPVMIYGPYRYWQSADPDGYWLSDSMWWKHSMAITVVYIWLAAVSVVVFLTFIIVLVVCCRCCDVQRALKKDADL